MNESWVAKSDVAEAEEVRSGKKWLGVILASCAILFIGSLTVIVLMFMYSSGCPCNEAFIAITLAMIIFVRAVQMLVKHQFVDQWCYCFIFHVTLSHRR